MTHSILDLFDTRTLRKTGHQHGGEYHGPCPFCGGDDRFTVWRRGGRGEMGHYWCRQCEARGDAVGLLIERDGVAYLDAVKHLGLADDGGALAGAARRVAMRRVDENGHTVASDVEREAEEAYAAEERARAERTRSEAADIRARLGSAEAAENALAERAWAVAVASMDCRATARLIEHTARTLDALPEDTTLDADGARAALRVVTQRIGLMADVLARLMVYAPAATERAAGETLQGALGGAMLDAHTRTPYPKGYTWADRVLDLIGPGIDAAVFEHDTQGRRARYAAHRADALALARAAAHDGPLLLAALPNDDAHETAALHGGEISAHATEKNLP